MMGSNVWMLVFVLGTSVGLSSGQCTWPNEFQNSTWSDSVHEEDLVFSTYIMRGFPVSAYNQDVDIWICLDETVSLGGILLFRSTTTLSAFGHKWFLYICMNISKVNEDEYKYYLQRPTEDSFGGERVYVNLSDNKTISSVCDPTSDSDNGTLTRKNTTEPIDYNALQTTLASADQTLTTATVSGVNDEGRTTTPIATADGENDKSDTPVLVALGIVGVLAILVIVVVAIWIFYWRRKGRPKHRPVFIHNEHLGKRSANGTENNNKVNRDRNLNKPSDYDCDISDSEGIHSNNSLSSDQENQQLAGAVLPKNDLRNEHEQITLKKPILSTSIDCLNTVDEIRTTDRDSVEGCTGDQETVSIGDILDYTMIAESTGGALGEELATTMCEKQQEEYLDHCADNQSARDTTVARPSVLQDGASTEQILNASTLEVASTDKAITGKNGVDITVKCNVSEAQRIKKEPMAKRIVVSRKFRQRKGTSVTKV